MRYIPYCGQTPVPGELLGRFNLDPILIVVLVAAAAIHLARIPARSRTSAAAGWLIAAAAFLSPLCALSVALFAARVGQHMILTLVAAPLLAWGLPAPRRRL